MADKVAVDGARVGRVCGMLSIGCGIIAFVAVPILFGVVGIVLGILAITLSAPDRKRLGIVGLAVSVVGLIAGSAIGIMMMTW